MSMSFGLRSRSRGDFSRPTFVVSRADSSRQLRSRFETISRSILMEMKSEINCELIAAAQSVSH